MMRHTIAPTSIIQRLFRCKRYTSNILLALRPKLFKLIALSLVVECLKKRGTIVIAAMGINNPLAGGSNPAKFHRLYPNRISSRNVTIQSRSDQDLVRTTWSRSQDNLRCLCDIPEDFQICSSYTPMKKEKSPKTKCRYVTNE